MPRLFAAALAAILGLSPSAASGRFYLTVERSFSDREPAQLRLDFTNTRTPLVLRVLRPRDLDRFLDGQVNLNRSYEQPLASINPGHYLMAGLNRADSPVWPLRSLLDPDLRKSFKSEVLTQALQLPSGNAVTTAPPELTLGAPDGFEVVREEYIDLQKGGEFTASSYTWDTDEHGGRYQVRQISLAPLPDGLYLLQGVQNDSEAQALLQVSSLSMQVKQSNDRLVARVIDRDQRPVAGAKLSYRDERAQWQEIPGQTDAGGEIVAAEDGGFDGKLLVRAAAGGGRVAITQTDFLPAINSDPAVFIVTDRPIFKPGETFFYKGTLRTREDGALVVPPAKSGNATVHLLRQDGSEAAPPQTVAMSDFASFSGSFDLDAAEPPGLYRLAAEIDERRYGGELRVRDYVKPTFYLELLARDPVIRPREPFHLAFRAKRYAGGVPQNVRYEVFVYRKKFEAPAWIAEAGAGLEAGADYSGEVRSATALSEPQRLYSSLEARVAAGQGDSAVPWASAPQIDGEGKAAVEIVLPETPEADAERDWIYSVMVRAMDRAGSQAVLTENVYVTLADAAVAARFDPTVSAGNEDLRLGLRTTWPDGTPAGDASGHVELTLESPAGAMPTTSLPFRSDERGFAAIEIKPPGAGRLRAVAVLDMVGEKKFRRPFAAQPAFAVITGDGGAAVVQNADLELHTDRTILSPGERARVVALLPPGWGAREEGVLWQTLAGRDVFSTETIECKGRSRWLEVEARPEYGTGFYQTITLPLPGGRYQEKTLGFRIVPSDKRLAIGIQPEAEIAAPLAPFRVSFDVRDASGAPAPDTELSVNIVDRAVYAVQPEFRPNVLEFYYPLPRLNLGTFYSDELQGYGYSAALLRPNFRLAALKSNIQPIKRDMRDTAGWFPHVVTDAQGRATVTAQMPANVTEWVVTAIAVDRSGRAGESKGMFRSARDIDVEPRVPPFLREGDAVEGTIELQNHTQNEATLDLTLAGSGGIVVEGQTDWAKITLPAQGAAHVPARVTGVASAESGILALTPRAATARTGGATAVDIDLEPATFEQTVSAKQDGRALRFDVPAEAKRAELQVLVVSGLLGAALHAAAELVQYPYGCTEQLSHSTLPNLILLQLVADGALDPSALAPLRLPSSVLRARANAQVGVQRLLANQKPDGAFGAWAGDQDSSFVTTLVAARVLALAAEQQIGGAERGFSQAEQWLVARLPGAELGRAELELMNEIGVGSPALSEQSAMFVQKALANEKAAPADVLTALRILQLRRHEYWFGQRLDALHGSAIRSAAASILAARLERQSIIAVDWRPSCEDLGDAGFCAGEAVTVAGIYGALDEAEALPPGLRASLTRRLIELLRDGWWRSTFDTAEVLLRLRGVMLREAQAKKEPTGQRLVRGSSADAALELIRFPGGFAGRFSLEHPGDFGRVEIDGLTDGELAVGTIRAEVPYRAVTRRAGGLHVRRTLLRANATTMVPVEPDDELEIGTVVVSQVVVERPGRASRWSGEDASPSDFVVVEDGVPSIAEAIEDDRPYLADAGIQADSGPYWVNVKETQRHLDRTVRVVNLKPGGAFTAYQVWRVGYRGTASLPPPHAFDMYDDAISGNDVAATISSAPRGASE